MNDFLDNMQKIESEIVDFLKTEFIKDIPNLKKFWLSYCESCVRNKECSSCVITRLLEHLDSFKVGDDNE